MQRKHLAFNTKRVVYGRLIIGMMHDSQISVIDDKETGQE